VAAYIFFLVLWVLIFAFFYQALGVGKGQGLTIFDYLGDSWTMSTKGDANNLSDNYWMLDDRSVSSALGDMNMDDFLSYLMTNFVSTVKYIN
jgi:hypothetical protein